ncbi:hypothetical protein Y032_0105g3651 [Ancylostoma ceylanicum]|uniref:Uncharacterized protein n=1 Tax=Ancylostoma ceylanicum TaxID=53326 RepID=A0A016TGA7_9BILA|nr:hypothetical protein Y032_0105g3651 [Ancylostoma ceylanicum]
MLNSLECSYNRAIQPSIHEHRGNAVIYPPIESGRVPQAKTGLLHANDSLYPEVTNNGQDSRIFEILPP